MRAKSRRSHVTETILTVIGALIGAVTIHSFARRLLRRVTRQGRLATAACYPTLRRLRISPIRCCHSVRVCAGVSWFNSSWV